MLLVVPARVGPVEVHAGHDGAAADQHGHQHHWHFDHSDNNASFSAAGARLVAHANTPKRMSESHELLGMQIPPSPAEALPTQTFSDTHSLDANGERIELAYIPPAHTDTDITIRYTRR